MFEEGGVAWGEGGEDKGGWGRGFGKGELEFGRGCVVGFGGGRGGRGRGDD